MLPTSVQRRPGRLELLKNALSHGKPATDALDNPSLAVNALAKNESNPREPDSSKGTYASIPLSSPAVMAEQPKFAIDSEGQRQQPPCDVPASPTLPLLSASQRDAKPSAAPVSHAPKSPEAFQQTSNKQMLVAAAVLQSNEQAPPSAIADLLPAEAIDAGHVGVELPSADQEASLCAAPKLAKVCTSAVTDWVATTDDGCSALHAFCMIQIHLAVEHRLDCSKTGLARRVT